LRLWAELSGENDRLALAELTSVLKTLSPHTAPPRAVEWGKLLCEFNAADPLPISARLSFTRRLLRPIASGKAADLRSALKDEGSKGSSGAIRSGHQGNLPEEIPSMLGKSYVEGGGIIDLEKPERTFVAFTRSGTPRASSSDSGLALAEEIAVTSRSALKKRPPMTLPFRKPVTLSPLLARALVNLSEVPPGGFLLDPFCGTGAILIEGGLLGCRLVAGDIDGRMVKGTLANLSKFGITPEIVTQTDVGWLPATLESYPPMDGIATDPPYGRSSSTFGEHAERVVDKALEVLPNILRKGARFSLMVPSPNLTSRIKEPWTLKEDPIPFRVHRSLTRWIFVLST
jgi:tRNA (guanine10-N2)-dimethyltransferase